MQLQLRDEREKWSLNGWPRLKSAEQDALVNGSRTAVGVKSHSREHIIRDGNWFVLDCRIMLSKQSIFLPFKFKRNIWVIIQEKWPETASGSAYLEPRLAENVPLYLHHKPFSRATLAKRLLKSIAVEYIRWVSSISIHPKESGCQFADYGNKHVHSQCNYTLHSFGVLLKF